MAAILAADAVEPFGLWPEHEPVIETAQACQWSRQIGAMGGQVWTGVNSAEVESVMRIRRTPTDQRWQLLQDVRRFISVACSELNRLESERAERSRSK